MKKFVSLLTIFAMMAALCACSGDAPKVDQKDENKLDIVCTIFPVYDWVREICAECPDAVELSFLLDSGVDLHSFQPSVADIAKIAQCDLFIYVGGESDEWVEGCQLPPVGELVTLIGTWGGYLEDDVLYCALMDAVAE